MAKREMTEEQKQANAERLAAARAKKAAEKAAQAAAEEKVAEIAKTPSENVEEAKVDPALEAMKAQNEMLQKQMEELQRQLLAMQRPQVIQVAQDTERVHFLWQAEVADYNLVTFGPGGMYGSITGKTGTFSVPKNDMSRILDDRTRRFLARRWLIVLSGLTDEEREALGVAYKDGEVLDRKVFQKMVDMPKDAICEVYGKLCQSNREIVGRRFYEAWQSRNSNVTRDKVIALRDIARESGDGVKAFQTILQEMNISEEE